MTETGYIRWAGAGILGAGLVLSQLPTGVGLPCPLRTFTGVPCPFCGMTTSVKATLTGDLAAAISANPAGVVLVAAIVYLLAAKPKHIRVPAAASIVAYAAFPLLWLFELNRFGFL